MYLENIYSPADVKKLSIKELVKEKILFYDDDFSSLYSFPIIYFCKCK